MRRRRRRRTACVRVLKYDGRKCMQGKWKCLSLVRTLSSLCHHHNHFILVMFVRSPDFLIAVGSNCSKTLSNTEICMILSFILLFSRIMCAYFPFLEAVSFDDVMLRFASVFASIDGSTQDSINDLFLCAIDLMLFHGMHIRFSNFSPIVHVLVC